MQVVKDGDSVHSALSIADPVSRRYQTRIFDKFVQVKARTEGRASHTARPDVVQIASRRIRADRRQKPADCGSHFWFTLPLLNVLL